MTLCARVRLPRTCLASLATLLALAGLATVPPASDAESAPPKLTRYSIVHGCFALRSNDTGDFVVRQGGGYSATGAGVGAAERFRFQATDLGRYLLYGAGRDFLALDGGAIEVAAEPSDDADWTVEGGGASFELVNEFAGHQLAVGDGGALAPVQAGGAGEAGSFELVAAEGCPEYPEVEVNVKGSPLKGTPRFGEVQGFVEGHMHGMAFEFLGGKAHCGRPWHRFGAPYALRDCADHEAGNGCAAVLDNVLYGNPARCHEPTGWPDFAGWPDHKSLTHEQSYWRWLERAWRGGLRLYTNLMVENRALCELYPLKQNDCDEMESVLLQIKRIHEMQDYIDAQSGGPGKGFFRIVKTPWQARKVINQGKLAVVLGMEVSEPFGCKLQFGAPMCDRAQITDWIDRLHKLGLRQFEITNKFDNALTGVAGDNGETGIIVNGGNFYTTGRFWDLEHCDDADNADNSPAGAHIHNDDALIANGFNAFTAPGTLPLYPEPPHCNTMGLSELGDHAIRELMRHDMLFDPDHMSVKGRNQALNLVEARDYSGVFSSHSWSTDNAYERILKLGGVVTPSSSEADNFVHTWQELRSMYKGRQYFGIGYGADQNGFASQPGPRDPGLGPPVRYPFRTFDGGSKVFAQQSGERTYDINTDGVAHYGLYPDWVEDLRRVGGRKIARDMARGAEAYLQMWERAEGIEEVRCDTWRRRALGGRGFARRLELGDRPKRVLKRAGQPVSRERAWKWCAHSRSGKGGREVVALFSRRERVTLIASTLGDHDAGRIVPGDRASRLDDAKRVAPGLYSGDAAGGRSYVYGTRGGRVSFVGVTAAELASSAVKLRAAVRRTGIG